MERAGKFQPGFAHVNQRYQELVRNNSPDTILRKFYVASFDKYTNSHFQNGFDLKELFDKMSIKYKNLDGLQTILFTFYGITLNATLPVNVNC